MKRLRKVLTSGRNQQQTENGQNTKGSPSNRAETIQFNHSLSRREKG